MSTGQRRVEKKQRYCEERTHTPSGRGKNYFIMFENLQNWENTKIKRTGKIPRTKFACLTTISTIRMIYLVWYHGIKNRNDRLNSLKVWVFTNHCVYESTGDLKLQENGKKYPQAFSASLPSRTAYYCCWCSSFCIITKNTHDTHILHLHHRSIPAFDNNACMPVPVLWCYDIPGMLDHIIAYIIYYTWYVIWCLRWWWWCVWRFDVFIGLMMVHTIILLCCAWSMYEYNDGLSWFQVIIHDRSWWRWCIVRAWMNSNNKQATNKRTSIIAQQFHTYNVFRPVITTPSGSIYYYRYYILASWHHDWPLEVGVWCVECRFFLFFFRGSALDHKQAALRAAVKKKWQVKKIMMMMMLLHDDLLLLRWTDRQTDTDR